MEIPPEDVRCYDPIWGIKDPSAITEAERDDTTARERARKIVRGAVDVFLSAVLDTPGDKSLDVPRLWAEVESAATLAAFEYRIGARQRFAEKAVATESLG